MAKIKAKFDGRVFVPCAPVQLAPGTEVELLPTPMPAKLTDEEMQEWKNLLQEIRSSEPPYRTVEEYLRSSRKRP